MSVNKIYSYIGFAIKAKKLRCGVNVVETLKKNVFLLILCSTASENTFGDAKKLKNKFNCPLLVLKGESLENLTHKPNCKLCAVCEPNLAKVIIDNSDETIGEIMEV